MLGIRRSELRQRTLRQAAYLNLIGAILERPAADVELTSPISTLPSRVAAFADKFQAA